MLLAKSRTRCLEKIDRVSKPQGGGLENNMKILRTFITPTDSSPFMPMGNMYMCNSSITHFGEMI